MSADDPSPYTHGRSGVWEKADLADAIRLVQRRLATRLRTLRNEHELTQEAAAQKAGIHAKYLVRLESG